MSDPIEQIVQNVKREVDEISPGNVEQVTKRVVTRSQFLKNPPSREAHIGVVREAHSHREIDINNPDSISNDRLQSKTEYALVELCKRRALYQLRKEQVA